MAQAKKFTWGATGVAVVAVIAALVLWIAPSRQTSSAQDTSKPAAPAPPPPPVAEAPTPEGEPEPADREPEGAPAELTFAHYLWMRTGRSREQATAAARGYLERSYARPFTAEQVPRFCAAGTADDVREQVAEYAAAGCQYLIAKPACEPDELTDQCAAIAEAFQLTSSGARAAAG